MDGQGVEVPIGAKARRNTISDAFHRSVRRNGPRPGLTFKDRIWTYAELGSAVDAVSQALLAAGLKRGDRVGAYGRNSDAYLILWLACAQAGLVHVPINYALTERELSYIVEQSGAQALFFDTALAPAVSAFLPRLRISGTFSGGSSSFDVLATALGKPRGPARDSDADETDLVQLLYTSGTTAAPKGAMMTHRALMAEYMACMVELEFTRQDLALAALPLYHSAQMHVFTMPQLLLGASTILIEAPAPDVCLRLIEEHRITSFFAPPTVWISLLRHPDFDRRDLTSLKNLYYGASIMPVPVLEELRRRLPRARPFNCYGQSEIAPLATVLRPEEHDARPASAGRPIMTVETRVVDTELRDVPSGTYGEIVHRSPQLLLGYWDKQQETEEAFEGGWFHSGDIGYMDDEGYLFIVDRVKDVIKTGGTMVASREVEEALFTHPAVSEVAVIALPDPKWIEAVTAVVVLRPGHDVTAEALIEHARTRLAPFKLPKRIIFRDELPRNTAGKLLKRELRSEYASSL
ncbi:fatty acyl-CoA synthetase [Microvirga thermotolerans]|uniref:3-methylmercaptopropionyl-CoA ligase n=1 Tax=Microvirga thermotolerans TaxID=2651334 RepID=A0A5P9JTE5_9HYPH|nr:fatty acyl-CoA synthetase [Microvirga thermotolerans]QFU16082.1 long-chain-fatty-acid--CoA ligase [Microvirga thermotolerans]